MSIKDVAARAGVSVATVSKALNNYRDVSVETRARIRKIAREMGYRPNPIASTLVKKESDIIGYVISSFQERQRTSILTEWLSGLLTSIATLGYEVMILPVDTQIQRKKSFAQFVRDYHLAGVVLQGLRMDDRYYHEVASSDTPSVLIDMVSDRTDVGMVMIDNEAASREAVSYLISRGHTRIAHVSGRADAWITAARVNGYRSALESAGIVFNPSYVVNGEFIEEPAFAATDALLRRYPEITAIFCASDVMAVGVMRAVRTHGLRIPDDVAIVGFDDVEWARFVTPSLTTVRQDFHGIGYEAARMLHRMISGTSPAHTLYVPHELIIRESAG